MPEFDDDVDRIASVAAAIPHAVRKRFVSHTCRDNESLTKAVSSRIRAYERTPDSLPDHWPGLSSAKMKTDMNLPLQMGDYSLVKQIGEGGFGQVFLAVRDDTFFAVKVLKPGRGGDAVLQRFRREAEVLSKLNHPNIARLHEYGVDNGQLFVVMEYVHGLTIGEFCRAKDVGLHERLQLFVQVCDAVGHAHRLGIVHRDIKPFNVLVQDNTFPPIPKVIDFGLAKPMADFPMIENSLTSTHDFVGSLCYTSPEQLMLQWGEVSCLTDIYGLGLLLYELITDVSPLSNEYRRSEDSRLALEIVWKRVCFERPVAPSVRVRQQADVSQSDDIPPEMDWITLKALRKNPGQRYESAAALKEDVLAFMHGAKVVARPMTWLEEFQQLYRLYPKNFGVVVAFLTILITLAASTTRYGLLAKQAEAVALKRLHDLNNEIQAKETALKVADQALMRVQRAESKALDEAQAAKTVTDIIRYDVIGPSPSPNAEEFNMPFLQKLKLASKSISNRCDGQPLIEADVRECLGNAFYAYIQHDLALQEFEKVYLLRRHHLGEKHEKTLLSAYQVAESHLNTGSPNEAMLIAEKVLQFRRESLGPSHPQTIESMEQLARAHMGKTNWQCGIDVLEDVLDRHRQNKAAAPYIVRSTRALAVAYRFNGNPDKSVELLNKLIKNLPSNDDDSAIDLLGVKRHLADIFVARRDTHLAKPILIECVADACEIYGRDHLESYRTKGELANVFFGSKEYESAERLYLECLFYYESMGPSGDQERFLTLYGLAGVLRDKGCHDEAEKTMRYVVSNLSSRYGDGIVMTSHALRKQASILRSQRRYEQEALWQVRTVISRIRAQGITDITTRDSLVELRRSFQRSIVRFLTSNVVKNAKNLRSQYIAAVSRSGWLPQAVPTSPDSTLTLMFQRIAH